MNPDTNPNRIPDVTQQNYVTQQNQDRPHARYREIS